MENFLKTSLLTASTIIPTAYISTIGLISWSQNVRTSKQVEEKIWDEAPYAVGAHVLVIMNTLYSEVPIRRACSLRFFRFFSTLLADFHQCSFNKSEKYFLPARLLCPACLAILPN